MKGKDTLSTPRLYRLRAIFVVAMAVALFGPGTGAGGSMGGEAVAANLPNMAAPAHQGTGEYDLCDILPVGPGIQLLPGPEGGQYECSVANNGAKRTFLHFSIKKRPSIEVAHREITDHVKFLDDLRKQSGGPTSEATTAYGDEGYGFFLPHNPVTNEWASLSYARNCYAVYAMLGPDPESSLKVLDPGPLQELAATIDRQIKDFPCDLPPTQKPATTDTEVDLKVQHIEVVQVVQDPENTIPLVAGKKTVVRVFVLAESESRDAIYNVGGSLSFWPEGKSEMQLQPLNQALGVKPFKSADRTALDSSINFVIPPELASAGNFTLKATVNPTRSIKETNHDNNEATELFEFVQRNGLRVGFVRIGYRPPGQTEWAWPSDGITGYDGMMKKLFPAADNGIQYYEMPFRVRTTRLISSDDDGENLNWDLREYYDRIQGDKPDILVGWLPKEYSKTFTFGGLAETVMSGQSAHVLLAVDYHTRYSSDHVLPHEVAHDLGLDHTGTQSDPRSDCRLSKNNNSSYWPQKYSDSATIQEIGFDTQAMKVIPGTYYDLMAYCSEAKTWLSTFHYMKLYDNNLRPQGAFVTDTAHKAWVRGWAAFKGYTAQVDLVRPGPSSGGSAPPPAHSARPYPRPNLAASLFLPLTSGGMQKATVAIQSEGEGNHCLRFLDEGDNVLYERCFDLTFVSNESGEPQERSGFVLGVPDPGNATRIVLVRNEDGQEQELTSLQATTQPPTLTITSPQSGDRWEGEHTISWSADDPDSDPATIRYDILDSPDAKKSWVPMQVGTHDTEYTF
ncbi:MAG TPA: hypothetical protein VEW94_11145, partial [Chloroflexia bacterium]|nr:hypothetical protein [Chloroflexia bacterium]